MIKIKTRKITRAFWRKLTSKQRRQIRWKAQNILDQEQQEKMIKTENSSISKITASWSNIKKLLGNK